MNTEIIMELLFVSSGASLISTQLIQKIKGTMNFPKNINKIISIIISISIGFIYSYSFYTQNMAHSIWVGLFTLIGSESLYKSYKETLNLSNSQNKNTNL